MMNMYVDTFYLLKKQKVETIVIWKVEAKMLEQWDIFISVTLGPPEEHLAVYELTLLIDTVEEFNNWLRAQAQYQKDTL